MSTAQSPQDRGPGGQYDNCGGTRVGSSLPAADLVMARLAALPVGDVAVFSRKLDAALREARPAEGDVELAEVTYIAVSARNLLRQRQAAAAGDRAKSIVRDLISTTETE